jgi:hypothetical protein
MEMVMEMQRFLLSSGEMDLKSVGHSFYSDSLFCGGSVMISTLVPL